MEFNKDKFYDPLYNRQILENIQAIVNLVPRIQVELSKELEVQELAPEAIGESSIQETEPTQQSQTSQNQELSTSLYNTPKSLEPELEQPQLYTPEATPPLALSMEQEEESTKACTKTPSQLDYIDISELNIVKGL